MKKNLAKLYAGINTIIYVNDARTYKYWDEKNDSKECIISPLDVENVIGDLRVCDNSVSVSRYNYNVYLKWLISEEYIESTPELIKGYKGNNMLIFLKHIPENGYNYYYLVYVRVIIPPTPTEGTVAIVSFHKASPKYNRYLYINKKGEELKSRANMSDLYSGILSLYVCENVYDAAKENNDREQLYYINDIDYFEQHQISFGGIWLL